MGRVLLGLTLGLPSQNDWEYPWGTMAVSGGSQPSAAQEQGHEAMGKPWAMGHLVPHSEAGPLIVPRLGTALEGSVQGQPQFQLICYHLPAKSSAVTQVASAE